MTEPAPTPPLPLPAERLAEITRSTQQILHGDLSRLTGLDELTRRYARPDSPERD